MTTPRWLFGLPFDCVNLEQARARVFDAIERRSQLVFATPNVSFVAQAQRDPRFREDVLLAGLSLPDGMPIVWLGRLMGIPFAERVAGSDLLDSLIAERGPRTVRVFFFGGNAGAAEAAMHAVNQRGGGVVAVGAIDPGFVGVDEMSDQATIDAINGSNADFLVVALGAAKGHRWIEANRRRLHVPVISHLGAAINFVAGRLQRAPRLLQRTGMEWLWRIKEEPALFRRYARDGWFLSRVVAKEVIPAVAGRLLRRRQALPPLAVERDGPVLVIRASGGLDATQVTAFRQMAHEHELENAAAVRIELRDVARADVHGMGWLYSMRYRLAGSGAVLQCDAVSMSTLRRWRADALAR